jgi:hypothetical protein
MDLLRAHADAILLGINTLMDEAQLSRNGGPVYSIEDVAIRKLREKLGLGREKNIFVTGAAYVNPNDYQVFDSALVESFIITTTVGARRLANWSSRKNTQSATKHNANLFGLRTFFRPTIA